MKHYQGSSGCLRAYGEFDPDNTESPHRCRCTRIAGHYCSNYEPHQCRCGRTWT